MAARRGLIKLSGFSSPHCLATPLIVLCSLVAPTDRPATASSWAAVRAPPFAARETACFACHHQERHLEPCNLYLTQPQRRRKPASPCYLQSLALYQSLALFKTGSGTMARRRLGPWEAERWQTMYLTSSNEAACHASRYAWIFQIWWNPQMLTHSSHMPGFVSLKGELMLPAGPVRLRDKNEAMSFLVDKVDCNAVVWLRKHIARSSLVGGGPPAGGGGGLRLINKILDWSKT